MAERFKAVVLKTTVAATSPGVRIPLAPLNSAVSWGGARVDDWGRLLSGCPGYTGPQVRILSSPHDRTLTEHCPELEPIVLLLSAFAFVQEVELPPFPRTVSEMSRKYANGVRNSNRMVPSGSMMTRSTIWRSNSF